MATPNQRSRPKPNQNEPNLQTPTQTPTLATTPIRLPRKLPIKRKQSPSDPSPSDGSASSADPPTTGDVRSSQPPIGDVRSPQPPRIWSEPDEIRFLQGLLGCKSQGLVFPRDLNLFYDQFSASMPQPYTRSQLSEKLRRLKAKHKTATARIAQNGLDHSRSTPHDKDVLHLCSRLWDPQNAASSPFFSATPGVSGNKRRRANPRPLPNNDDGTNTYEYESNEDNDGNIISSHPSVAPVEGRAEVVDSMQIDSDPKSNPIKEAGPSSFPVPSPSPIKTEENNNNNQKANNITSISDGNKNKPMELRVGTGDNGSVIAKAVLDVFEECLKEVGTTSGETEEDAIKKKWRALRVAELDVLARRMRLMIEDATAVAR